MSRGSELSGVLARLREGDDAARSELWERVYGEVRRQARAQLARERPGHTLQSSALASEVWLRLTAGVPVDFEGRAHFFGAVTRAMRRVLVDHARRRAVRPGGAARVTLADLSAADSLRLDLDFEALDRALQRLEAEPAHARKAQVVSLRFFAGRDVEETAELLGISPATVKRDWRLARAWLYQELGGQDG